LYKIDAFVKKSDSTKFDTLWRFLRVHQKYLTESSPADKRQSSKKLRCSVFFLLVKVENAMFILIG